MIVNTGKILVDYFEKHRTHKAVLARLLGIKDSSLAQYQKNESIQTKRLLEICSHLKHNFFMDIAVMLPTDYSTTKNPFEDKDQRIAALEDELRMVKNERDLLLKVLGK